MLDILKNHFKPSGFGDYAELCRRFHNLILADCKDVTDYTAQFRQLNNQLKALNATVILPESYLVQRYLLGLGPAYSVFQTTFAQTNKFFGEGHVTFNIVVGHVRNEETRQATQDTEPAAVMFVGKSIEKENRRVMEVDWCIHCEKSNHTAEVCRAKHPHLKKAFEKKRAEKRGYDGNKGGRDRKRPKTDKAEKKKEDDKPHYMRLVVKGAASSDSEPTFHFMVAQTTGLKIV